MAHQPEILNDVELDSDYSESPNIEQKQATELKEKEEDHSAETWWNTAYKVGENVLFVVDFLGEVFAEFFGMTQSRYQWAIDAHERQQRWEREDQKKEEIHKKMLIDQYKKNKRHKRHKKEISTNDCEFEDVDINPNNLSLSIKNRNNVIIDEEELRMNYMATNKLEDDGKEEEENEPEIMEGNNENDPVEVS
eukprot:UN07192